MRTKESFSLGRSVARTIGSRPEQRSGLSALRARFHEGRGPPLKGGLRPEPRSIADHGPLRRGVWLPRGGSDLAGAGAAEPKAERSAPRPPPRQEQNAETPRNTSKSCPGHPPARLGRRETVPG